MTKIADDVRIASVALTDDLVAMTAYVRSAAGRVAIRRGLSDVRRGKILKGEGVLAAELMRRAADRRA